ncbi:MAG: hypothetical protein KKE76_02470 [Gammaproteobacteria bacterium]|nr:hypothetical protein [Gammaproteobacteria bacterium]
MYIRFDKSIVFGMILWLAGTTAQSALLTYNLSGPVFPTNAVFTSIGPNAQWSAWFTIDTETADISPDPLLGKYLGVIGEISISGTTVAAINSTAFSNTFINVGNEWVYVSPDYDFLDFNGDQSNGSPSSPAAIDGYQMTAFEIGIADWSGTIFNDTSLIGTVNITSSDFQGSMFQLEFGTYQINGIVNTFTVTAVPLPAAAWLFGAGILSMLCTARRNNKMSG